MMRPSISYCRFDIGSHPHRPVPLAGEGGGEYEHRALALPQNGDITMRTAIRARLLVSWFTLILVSSGGCYGSKHMPLVETHPASNVQYRCEMKRVAGPDSRFCSTIYKATNGKKKSLRLQGLADGMTVNNAGDLIAIVIRVPTDHDESPPVYVPDHDAIVFIDTENLREINRWPIKPPGVALSAPGLYVQPIAVSDELALSDDGKMIATYYLKPVDSGMQSMVTLWDVASGECLKELPLGPPGELLLGAHDLAFSSNGELVALSCGAGAYEWTKDPAGRPDPYIFIWRTSDASRYALRPKGHWLISSLCFDQPGTRLACLGDNNTVLVWAIPEGKLLLSKRFKNPVSAVIRSSSEDSFRVKMKDGSDVHIEYVTR